MVRKLKRSGPEPDYHLKQHSSRVIDLARWRLHIGEFLFAASSARGPSWDGEENLQRTAHYLQSCEFAFWIAMVTLSRAFLLIAPAIAKVPAPGKLIEVWPAICLFNLTELFNSRTKPMPKTPASEPPISPICDLRLPSAALAYRTSNNLLSQTDLGTLNVTAWLYCDKQGVEGVQVNPNVTIAQLKSQFGSAPTADAELGFHSEAIAAEWFRTRPQLKVLQIFTERYPCAKTCAPLLKHYYPGRVWYYYYRPSSWTNDRGQFIARAAAVLKSAYGLP